MQEEQVKRKRIVFGMEQQTIRIWMETHHPTTIINDRYGGIYSGALWLAFPLEHYEAPREADGSDMVCVLFWEEYREPVGKGASPQEAFENLKTFMSELSKENRNDQHQQQATH